MEPYPKEAQSVKITCSKPSPNRGYDFGRYCSRVTIRADDGKIIAQVYSFRWDGRRYCEEHPNSREGKEYHAAIEACKQYEASERVEPLI